MKRFLHLLMVLGVVVGTGIVAQQTPSAEDQRAIAPSSIDKVTQALSNFGFKEKTNTPSSSSTAQQPAKKKVPSLRELAAKPAKKYLTELKSTIEELKSTIEELKKNPPIWILKSEDKKTKETLIKLILEEKEGIACLMYEFNLYEVAYALCKASLLNNIPVSLIMDHACKHDVALLLMKRCGIPIKFNSPGRKSGGIMHVKDFIFGSNDGISFLNKTYGTKQDSSRTSLFWTGSYNTTGAAEEKNIERTSIYISPNKRNDLLIDYNKLWKDSSHSKEDNRLENLNKDEDRPLNGVPSKNVPYLLQSKFFSFKGQEFIDSYYPILECQDFMPISFRDQEDFKNKYNIMPRLANEAEKELLTKAYCFFITTNSEGKKDFYVLMKTPDQTPHFFWLPLTKQKLIPQYEQQGWIAIKPMQIRINSNKLEYNLQTRASFKIKLMGVKEPYEVDENSFFFKGLVKNGENFDEMLFTNNNIKYPIVFTLAEIQDLNNVVHFSGPFIDPQQNLAKKKSFKYQTAHFHDGSYYPKALSTPDIKSLRADHVYSKDDLKITTQQVTDEKSPWQYLSVETLNQ